jgi:hypothetical protein
MREQVILRDRTCVYPFCEMPSPGCDLDHIETYHRARPGQATSRRCVAATTGPGPGPRYTVDPRGIVTRH